MDSSTFDSQIGRHIFAEMGVYGKKPNWPYLDLKHGRKLIYGLSTKFYDNGYSFPHCVSAVYWVDGHITYKFLPIGNTAISYDFMGCYMAKIEIDNFWYIFHIHSSNERNLDCKEIWKSFITSYDRRITSSYVFRPIVPDDSFYTILQRNKIERVFQQKKVECLSGCGIITPDNKFYSAIINKQTHQVYKNYIQESPACLVQ